MDPNRYRLQQHNGHRKDVSWMTLRAGPSSGKSTTQNPRKEQMASRHSSPKKRRQDRNKFKSGESPSRSNGSLRTAFPFTARADCETLGTKTGRSRLHETEQRSNPALDSVLCKCSTDRHPYLKEFSVCRQSIQPWLSTFLHDSLVGGATRVYTQLGQTTQWN